MFSNIKDRIRLLFRKDRESYFRFYKMLGFYPKDISIYEQALLHKSLSVKSEKGRLLNNERLEFLGDAILDAVVADIVYKRFEGKREGFLTNTRSKIVQRETLNRLAIEIGLDKLIKYTARQSSHNSYMCGNAFEALVGAIYLDRGYRACKYFMEHRIIGSYINLEKISRKEVNFKSKLIEWSQKNRFEVTFELITQSHDQGYNPTFESEVLVEGISGGKVFCLILANHFVDGWMVWSGMGDLYVVFYLEGYRDTTGHCICLKRRRRYLFWCSYGCVSLVAKGR